MKNTINSNATVFRFNVWFEGDIGTIQERFVVADNEEEAVQKLEKYIKGLKKQGYAQMLYNSEAIVELDYCIV